MEYWGASWMASKTIQPCFRPPQTGFPEGVGCQEGGMNGKGRLTGFEPATSWTTTRCSTPELQPPAEIGKPSVGLAGAQPTHGIVRADPPCFDPPGAGGT